MWCEKKCKWNRLYKEMDELDQVKAILMQKVNRSDSYLNAVVGESTQNWKVALDAYKGLLDSELADVSLNRRELYYESGFRCFSFLSKWEDVSAAITKIVSKDDGKDCWNSLWDQDWNQKKMLPWYIKTEIRKALLDKSEINYLLSKINECLTDTEKFEYLKAYFSEELAVLRILSGDIGEAKQHVEDNVSIFLENWSNLNPLFDKLRFNKILSIRNTIDMGLFVDEYSKLLPANYENIVNQLLKYWKPSTDISTTPLVIFETEILYRQEFLSTLNRKLEIMVDDDVQYTIGNIYNTKFSLNYSLIDTAIKYKNYYMARKYYLQQNKSTCTDNANWTAQLHLALSKLGFLKSNILSKDSRVQCLVDCWESVGPVLSCEIPTLSLQGHIYLYVIINEISRLLTSNTKLFLKYKSRLEGYASNHKINNSADLQFYGVEKLHNFLDECLGQLNESQDTYGSLKENIIKAYIKLAYFAQKWGESTEELCICSVLRAMKLGSEEGIQLFPCILDMKNLGTIHKELFISEANDIPIWMFLRWIPQLLAVVDTDKVFAIVNIIKNIADVYPQSIMYAYKLSKENYVFHDDDIGNAGMQLVKRLDELLLSNGTINKLLTALSCVGVPVAMLQYYVKKLFKACQVNSEKEFSSTYSKLLNELYNEEPNSKDVTKTHGNMYKQIACFKSQIKTLSGKFNGSKFMESLNKLHTDLANYYNTRSKPNISANLADYCPWLQNFSGTEISDIEIPGQYTGERQPLTQYHIKISGFLPKVTVMSSLRKPIKLTIIGNNAKEYPYLIKFGEDLRQDQRIEQLFQLMNNIFKNDCNSFLLGSSIITYQVIPLTTSLGMIEWLEDMPVLIKFLKDNINDDEELNRFNQAHDKYQNWIDKAKKSNSKLDAYALALQKYSKEVTIANYSSLVNSLAWNTLRNAFWNLSVNAECFVALKYNFIKSYAVLCIAQWFLGIGDRHLENSMISLKNGCVVGIDFGHAFGTATQILPVPELVPFRLTPQIVNMMQPLGEHGLFSQTMIHTLNALKCNRDALLATMNIFIQEPSLDWKEYASQYFKIHDESKITQAQEKLAGANPVLIFVKDLQANACFDKCGDYKNAYIKLVRGDPDYNVRAKFQQQMSTEKQIECLIDLATDRNILGRMYAGYAPWV